MGLLDVDRIRRWHWRWQGMAVLPLCVSLVWQGLTAFKGAFLFLFVRALAGAFLYLSPIPNHARIVPRLSPEIVHLIPQTIK